MPSKSSSYEGQKRNIIGSFTYKGIHPVSGGSRQRTIALASTGLQPETEIQPGGVPDHELHGQLPDLYVYDHRARRRGV